MVYCLSVASALQRLQPGSGAVGRALGVFVCTVHCQSESTLYSQCAASERVDIALDDGSHIVDGALCLLSDFIFR